MEAISRDPAAYRWQHLDSFESVRRFRVVRGKHDVRAGQMLTLDQTNFLMLNEDSHGNAATDLIITF